MANSKQSVRKGKLIEYYILYRLFRDGNIRYSDIRNNIGKEYDIFKRKIYRLKEYGFVYRIDKGHYSLTPKFYMFVRNPYPYIFPYINGRKV